MTTDPKLLTPRDWQAAAHAEAVKLLGSPEGAERLAEARRYGALADEIETLRAQVAQYKEDGERLHYVLRRLPGSILRSLIGTMSDTGDIDEFRAAIDKARKA